MADPADFDIEKPACFYLGREYDLANKVVLPDSHVMYDARDLTTHGVVVGMTGSGKTGLCISILEEAAIDGIPTIIIDPKGDLTNLLLQFPDLDPAMFRQWLNEEDAVQRGLTPDAYAKQLSGLWRKGLADTGQTPDRIRRLMQAAEWRIYTPGSEAGLPLSILGSFAAPKTPMPNEALTHKIDATATALLGLTGITADPVQSREHILIAQLLYHAWTNKTDLDLAGLIHQIQTPPIREVGAYNLETFFPAKERIKFASTLNNVLAAPSFTNWTHGEPLDLANMLYRGGKPQQLIFYIAHLEDQQRMFFTTLLLEEVLNWTRRQTGSSNLRALLYFDEVFGYLPPHPLNPPSKQPLLTLLKQARAFGVGVLLATQNPVDLDYKALSNAGTWFVGKLQTERDKARLLEGLETVAAEQGTLTDRSYLETVISSLGSRIFLLHDIHRPKPVLFQSRWALTFLRGPMTRDEVSKLMGPVKKQSAEQTGPLPIMLCTWCHAEVGVGVVEHCPSCGKNPFARSQFRVEEQAFKATLGQPGAPKSLPQEPTAPMAAMATAAAPAPGTPGTSLRNMPPVLPPDVMQFYLTPVDGARKSNQSLTYRPALLGFADVTYLVDRRTGREHVDHVRLLAEPTASGHPAAWDTAKAIDGTLDQKAPAVATWDSVPASLDTGKKLKTLEKAFLDHLAATKKLELFENRTLKLVSDPGETAKAFQERCRVAADQEKQQALEMEKVKFRPKFAALDAKLPDDEKPKPPEKPKKGGGFLGLFGGSKSEPVTEQEPDPSDKAAMRRFEKLKKLKADYEAKQAEITEKWRRVGVEATPIQVKPKKADIRVTHFGLAWRPRWS